MGLLLLSLLHKQEKLKALGLAQMGLASVCLPCSCWIGGIELLSPAGAAASLCVEKTRHLCLLENRWFKGAAEKGMTKDWEQAVEGLEWW